MFGRSISDCVGWLLTQPLYRRKTIIHCVLHGLVECLSYRGCTAVVFLQWAKFRASSTLDCEDHVSEKGTVQYVYLYRSTCHWAVPRLRSPPPVSHKDLGKHVLQQLWPLYTVVPRCTYAPTNTTGAIYGGDRYHSAHCRTGQSHQYQAISHAP